MELQGRAAFVTGGSGDLGAAICERLARAGCDIAIGYVGQPRGRGEGACAWWKASAAAAAMVQVDQADAAACEPAVNAAAGALGRLDVLVNNAGWNIGIPFPDLDALTADVWDRLQNTNLRGPFLLAKAAAPHMRKQGGGPHREHRLHCGPATHRQLHRATPRARPRSIHLTRCLAVALAPAITVNCVAPGLIEGTRMAQRIPPAVAESVRRTVVLRPRRRRRRHRRAGRDVLPRRQRHRAGARGRRRPRLSLK